MGILKTISNVLDVAQPIRPAARAVAGALAPKEAAPAKPVENKGYTERLTAEKSAIGGAAGAMKSMNTNTGDLSIKKGF